MSRAVLGLLLVALCAAGARAEPKLVRKLPATDPLRKPDPQPGAFVWRRGLPTTNTAKAASAPWKRIVLLAEGYVAGQESLFKADCEAMATTLYGDPASAAFLRNYNIELFYVFTASKSAVTLDGSANGTAYGTRSLGARLDIAHHGMFVKEAAASLVKGTTPSAIGIVCRLAGQDQNPTTIRAWAQPPYVGAGVGFLCLPSGAGDALVHELGHALFSLGDEYDSGALDANGKETTTAPAGKAYERQFGREPNLSNDPKTTRWRAATGSGVVEGGGGFSKGIFRPFAHCRMNESRSQDFCNYCRDHIAAVAYGETIKRGPYSVRTGISVLDPLRVPQKTTGHDALLYTHRPTDAPVGRIELRAGQPLDLDWAVVGFLPETWTIEVREGSRVLLHKEVAGTATGLVVNGLPALKDPKPDGRSFYDKAHYVVWFQSSDNPGVWAIGGVVHVSP